jgi:hypothetical protein
MRQQSGYHQGYEVAAAQQAQMRAERAPDRLAQHAMPDAGPARGRRARVQGSPPHARIAAALVISVPMLYTLNAAHAEPRSQRCGDRSCDGYKCIRSLCGSLIIMMEATQDRYFADGSQPVPAPCSW